MGLIHGPMKRHQQAVPAPAARAAAAAAANRSTAMTQSAAATAAALERVQTTPGLMVRIMGHLGTPSDAARAEATCSSWRDAATGEALENSLWREACAEWPLLALLKARPQTVARTWRQLYGQRVLADRQTHLPEPPVWSPRVPAAEGEVTIWNLGQLPEAAAFKGPPLDKRDYYAGVELTMPNGKRCAGVAELYADPQGGQYTELQLDGTATEGHLCHIVSPVDLDDGPTSHSTILSDIRGRVVDTPASGHRLSVFLMRKRDEKYVTLALDSIGQWKSHVDEDDVAANARVEGFARVDFMSDGDDIGLLGLVLVAELLLWPGKGPGCTCDEANEQGPLSHFACICGVGTHFKASDVDEVSVYCDEYGMREDSDTTGESHRMDVGTLAELLARLESPQCQPRWA